MCVEAGDGVKAVRVQMWTPLLCSAVIWKEVVVMAPWSQGSNLLSEAIIISGNQADDSEVNDGAGAVCVQSYHR